MRIMSIVKAETLAHYRRLEACRNWDDFILEGWGWKSCPLCLQYQVMERRIACEGCPVKRATGRPSCMKTPWDEMNDAIRSLERSAMPLIAPLPEVVEMATWLEAIDWEGVP